jgi:23S rRNA (guanosine2251-2'-O)-methyltransferase
MPILILHNIRSVHNVGSIFRTADAAGIAKIFLTGYTPAPLDRFGRERKDFVKVSLGAEKSVPWESAAQLTPVLKKLKKGGYTVLAIEQNKKSTSLFDYHHLRRDPAKGGGKPYKIAVVMGNEVLGISPQSLTYADHILEIPMRGKKESLNVSVAAGVALFALVQKII